GAIVEHGNEPGDVATTVDKRHGHVAFNVPLSQEPRVGKPLQHATWDMHQSTGQHFGSRAGGEVKVQVLRDMVALPDRQGTSLGWNVKLAHGRVMDTDGLGEMADERAKELPA